MHRVLLHTEDPTSLHRTVAYFFTIQGRSCCSHFTHRLRCHSKFSSKSVFFFILTFQTEHCSLPLFTTEEKSLSLTCLEETRHFLIETWEVLLKCSNFSTMLQPATICPFNIEITSLSLEPFLRSLRSWNLFLDLPEVILINFYFVVAPPCTQLNFLYLLL